MYVFDATAPRPRSLAGTFDYVIVGAGSAGCVVARRLVEGTGATVLLIEAGGDDEGSASLSIPPRWVENLGSAYDWAYTYAPSPHVADRTLKLARGKVLGGSGSINAMLWARGHRDDYDGWARAGNPGWDFDSVLPLFKRSEDWVDGEDEFRGAGGPMHIERARDLDPASAALIEAGRSFGMPYLHDLNVPEPEGVGPQNLNVRKGLRCSPSSAFLRPVLYRENLTVMTAAQVVKLRLSETHCVGLDLLVDGRVHPISASREVIVCAGTIDTPRLLMLSGIGPARELEPLEIAPRVNLPGVGRNLHDHVVASLCFEAGRPLLPFNNNLSGSACFWKSRPDLGVPDLMFVPIQVPYLSEELRARYSVPPNAFSLMPALMRPESRGVLRMTSARHDGPLEIQPNFLAEKADVDALVAGIEIGFELASQPAFRELIKGWVAPTRKINRQELTAFLRLACRSYHHPVGTCAMGTGPEAVVDPELRVRGVEGLRIADASIMPTIPTANTQAPTIMIGEFAARLVLAG